MENTTKKMVVRVVKTENNEQLTQTQKQRLLQTTNKCQMYKSMLWFLKKYLQTKMSWEQAEQVMKTAEAYAQERVKETIQKQTQYCSNRKKK